MVCPNQCNSHRIANGYAQDADAGSKNMEGLQRLTNLPRLHNDAGSPREQLAQDFSLMFKRYDSIRREVPLNRIWSIASLQQLTKLELVHYYGARNIEPGPPNLWPELESLTLNIDDASVIINRLGCELSLKTLSLNAHDNFQIDIRILIRFPNLRTLSLVWFDWFGDPAKLSDICVLQQVHSLDLSVGLFENFGALIDMVTNMPNLRYLKLTAVLFFNNVEGRRQNANTVGGEVKRALKNLELRNPPFEFEVSLYNGWKLNF